MSRVWSAAIKPYFQPFSRNAHNAMCTMQAVKSSYETHLLYAMQRLQHKQQCTNFHKNNTYSRHVRYTVSKKHATLHHDNFVKS